MFSVTQRIKAIKQPRLGYLPVKNFEVEKYDDEFKVNELDKSQTSIQGMVVDYLTRFMINNSKEKSFEISLKGAKLVNQQDKAYELLEQIKGLDDYSIIAACKIVGYDVAYRRGPFFFNTVDNINADKNLIENIKVLVNRSIKFINKKGPVVLDGFTFEGGLNNIISSGDGDYLTNDTLWDFKVSKYKPKPEHTLQILIYYILGIHSINNQFKSIKKLGIYNPILNESYVILLDKIDNQIFYDVSKDVIGYKMPDNIADWKNGNGTSDILKK